MNCEKLLKNIMEQIKEAQMKLGYVKETVRLYYPLSSLRGMLKSNLTDAELVEVLAEELGEDSVLGTISFTLRGERVEVGISPQGAEYVHENIEEPAFLKAVIQMFSNHHHHSLEEFKALFASFDKDYICKQLPEKMATDMGFQYVLYFRDTSMDACYYCVKEEMGHLEYHRFMAEDLPIDL